MARFNAMLDEERRLMLRIGVHLGEVIVDAESGHIFGDGVNVAARIQGLAEPGGIAVSRAVRDVIEPQDAYGFVDGGEHRAKNVSRRLHIYHVRVRDGASTRATAAVVPQTTLRFHGTDLSGREFGFELAFDRLAKSREGLVHRPRCRPVRGGPVASDGIAAPCAAGHCREHPADRGPGIDQRHGGRRRGRDCRRPAAAPGRRPAQDRRHRA